MLPSEITLQRSCGDTQIEVIELSNVDTPDNDGGKYRSHLFSGWGGHSISSAPDYMLNWTFPEKVEEVRQKVEDALEEGIPDQKRVMLRNQSWGSLDERFVDDIALGFEVENPWQKWSRAAKDTCRVAVCIDSTSPHYEPPEKIEARMCVAAGIAGALESLDYEVSVVAAEINTKGSDRWQPRTSLAKTYLLASVLKDESESLTHSGFASVADTGIRRLLRCWSAQSNGYATQLTDQEWREIVQADLYIYIGNTDPVCEEGIPAGVGHGLKGSDVLRLDVEGHRDVDSACATLTEFFGKHDN